MSDIDCLNECMTRDIILMLMDDQHTAMQQTMGTLYNSDTYAKLQDERTGLYFQSPVYVYNFLKSELLTGKMS